jgi:hypothetical protein
MTKEQFLDFSLETQIDTWNEFAIENGWNEYFYENDEFTIKELYHDNPIELAYHIHWGEYNYNDTYIYYDDLGHLISISNFAELHDIIDIDEMLNWYNENNTEVQK